LTQCSRRETIGLKSLLNVIFNDFKRLSVAGAIIWVTCEWQSEGSEILRSREDKEGGRVARVGRNVLIVSSIS
jgi:hypothetical protein